MTGRHGRGDPWARLAIALAAVGALTAGIGVWSTLSEDDDRCAPDTLLVAPCGAWWGAYIPYDKDSSLTRPVYAFEKKIGRRLDLVYTYHDMSGSKADGELLTPDERELGRDRLLMLAWESTVWTEKHHADWTEKQLGWKNIAAGTYDTSVIDPQALRIKEYGKRVFFAFDQEADFRIEQGAGTPEEYVAAYRHVRDRFQKLGVTNVVWVWTVSGWLGNAALMKRLYPGDAYVDWLGMDQYNYYLCHKSPNWLDFDKSQRPSYDWLRKNISADKPVMLSEFATAPDPKRPERQRDWYKEIPGVAPTLPEAKAYVHWNRAVPGPGCDLTVDSGPGLEGYRIAGRDPYFKQPLPRR
ncbi:glycosyl hydrolase [Streptomyces sp. Root431]|uniref:glycosyl hydrolase n=1 Tax=Streptomyces sp. Root431 TaxID=1736535 RepID=UPI000ABBCBBD|nr:glycosyl hydrolase [Streptomyces sp. Root431]